MEPTLDLGERVLVNRLSYHFARSRASATSSSSIRRPAPSTGRPVRRASREPDQACPEPTPSSRTRTSSSGSSPGPATRSASRTATRSSTASAGRGGLHPALQRRRDLQFAGRDRHPARPLLHDGRQPWGERRQPLLGPRPQGLDHRQGLLHLLAPRGSGSSNGSAGGGAPPPAGGEAVSLRPRAGRRYVAGGDEAGRGSLAGPLVAAAVLIDYERPEPARPPRARRARRLEEAPPEEREELYPVVVRAAAPRVAVTVRCVRGIDSRGLHVTNIAALRRSLERVAVPGAACLVDGFRLPGCAVEHQPVIDGDARSAAIAAASVIAKVTRDRYMCRVDRVLSRVRLRRERRLLDPGAPRRDHRARPLGAAPPLVPVDRLHPARALGEAA